MFASIRAWFHDSETIVWSRLKAFAGTALFVLFFSGIDVSALFPSPWDLVWKLVAAFLVADGFLSEKIRKWRDPEMK